MGDVTKYQLYPWPRFSVAFLWATSHLLSQYRLQNALYQTAITEFFCYLYSLSGIFQTNHSPRSHTVCDLFKLPLIWALEAHASVSFVTGHVFDQCSLPNMTFSPINSSRTQRPCWPHDPWFTLLTLVSFVAVFFVSPGKNASFPRKKKHNKNLPGIAHWEVQKHTWKKKKQKPDTPGPNVNLPAFQCPLK